MGQSAADRSIRNDHVVSQDTLEKEEWDEQLKHQLKDRVPGKNLRVNELRKINILTFS